jgi:hypothetical protein
LGYKIEITLLKIVIVIFWIGALEISVELAVITSLNVIASRARSAHSPLPTPHSPLPTPIVVAPLGQFLP